jgi:hypothetical protein
VRARNGVVERARILRRCLLSKVELTDTMRDCENYCRAGRYYLRGVEADGGIGLRGLQAFTIWEGAVGKSKYS